MVHFVIASNNPAKSDASKANWLQVMAGAGPAQFSFIDSSSMCSAYNKGIKQVSRGDEVVVFTHNDVLSIRPDFGYRLLKHFRENSDVDVIGGAGANHLIGPQWFSSGPPRIFGSVLNLVPPQKGKLATSTGQLEECDIPQHLSLAVFGVPKRLVKGCCVLDGFFIAARNKNVLKWDEATFTHFHFYDLDATFNAFQYGYGVAVANDLGLLHMSQGGYGQPEWAEQAPRFLKKWAAYLPPQPAQPMPFNSAGIVCGDLHHADTVMEQMVLNTEK